MLARLKIYTICYSLFFLQLYSSSSQASGLMEIAEGKVKESHKVAKRYAEGSWTTLFYAYFSQLQYIYSQKYFESSGMEKQKFIERLINQETNSVKELQATFAKDEYSEFSAKEINYFLLEDVLKAKEIINNIRRGKSLETDKVIASSEFTQDVRRMYTTFREVIGEYCITGHYVDINNPVMPDFNNFFSDFTVGANASVGENFENLTFNGSMFLDEGKNDFDATLMGHAGTITMAALTSAGFTILAAAPYALAAVAVAAAISSIKFHKEKIKASREKVSAHRKYWEDRARSIDVATYSKLYCDDFNSIFSDFNKILVLVDTGNPDATDKLRSYATRMDQVFKVAQEGNNEDIVKMVGELSLNEMLEYLLTTSLSVYNGVQQQNSLLFGKIEQNKVLLSNKDLRKRYRDLTIVEKQLKGRNYREKIYKDKLSNNESLYLQYNYIDKKLYFIFIDYLAVLTNFKTINSQLSIERIELKKKVDDLLVEISSFFINSNDLDGDALTLLTSQKNRIEKLSLFLSSENTQGRK